MGKQHEAQRSMLSRAFGMVRVGIILISMSPGITGICGRPRRTPVMMRNVNPPLGQNRATPDLASANNSASHGMYHRPDVPSVCIGATAKVTPQACEPRSRIDSPPSRPAENKPQPSRSQSRYRSVHAARAPGLEGRSKMMTLINPGNNLTCRPARVGFTSAWRGMARQTVPGVTPPRGPS